MVFEMQVKNIKKKPKPNDVRCNSADSGVSVALSRTHKRDITKSSTTEINGFEEEDLDFEFEDSQNQSILDLERIYSDQSTVKDFNLDNREDFDSNYPPSESTTVEYSISNVSIAHRRDMLPLPRSDTDDRRQNQYLPSCYTSSVSVRTTLDSSSEDSVDSETERNYDADIQDNFTRDRSGNIVEENSSTYSITQEEEDRLLGSSEDESHGDNNFFIQTDFVETCRIGNARITIPKFVSKSPKERQSNDLKRNNSTAKLRTFECKKKKKKWDLPFKPKNPFTYVYLDDIGYIDEDCEEDTVTSEQETHLSQPQFGSLIVICNKDKILCEAPGTTNQREIISLSNDGESNFKLPLPPPKRPPTRPKRTVCNTEGSSTNLQIKFSNKRDEIIRNRSTLIAPKEYKALTKSFRIEDDGVADKDDAISILASTIGGDNVDDIANLEQLEDIHPLSPNEPNYLDSTDTPRCVDDRVKEWVENVGNMDTSKNIPKRNIDLIPNFSQNNVSLNLPNLCLSQLNSSLNTTKSQPNSKRNGIILMPPISAKGNPRINFRDIPNMFIGLCYHYYFSGNCVKPNCSLFHIVHVDKFVNKIQKVDPKEVFKYFQFAMRFEKLFKEIYPSFVIAFGKLKMQNELITCIKYFLKMKEIDCVEAIDLVVKALQESGLSFQDAIEMISFNIGFLEHPVLADILMDLITRSYDISDNWEVIKRISKARGKIKPSIVSRIFLSMVNVYPVNKELCREIYNMIVKNNMTDLAQIRDNVLIPVRTLIDFQDGTKSSTTTTVPDAQPRALLIPNAQELLSAHIDNKLIKEREFFERKVEGTTVRTKVDCEPSHSVRNSNYESQKTTYDNRSQSSDSDDRYFQPSVRLSPFSSREFTSPVPKTNPYLRKDFSRLSPSVSSSAFESSNNDIDIALRFEPPSEVSEYVPEIVRSSKRNEPEEVKVSLTPPRPIFGNPCYRSNFRLDNSIHNLLPDSFENVSINERDVAKLSSVVKSRNGVEFYELLQYYKDPPTLQNFITMTVVNLKSSVSSIYDTLVSFRQSFASINPDFAVDRVIKGIIEVIVMNCLFEIEKKGHWQQGRSILELFCDWDSLVSSKIFSKRSITHMGRYIFLAKIFAKANNFHLTYEILQSPELKLLGPPESWPYFYNYQADLESRNTVLKEFFKSAHQDYIIGVADMYRRIYKYGGIYKFEAEVHFNPMLIAMINDQQTLLLKYFLPDIDVYYKVMDKNVLRAFTILLADQLNQDRLFSLYELCCERQIYTKFVGGETNITVRNNMFNIELQLLLNYYFYKMSQTRLFPVGNVTIHIKLMDNKPLYPKMLQKCIRSIKEINNNVKKILKDHYSILTPETSSEQLTTIEIQHEQIKKWVQCNQRWYPVL